MASPDFSEFDFSEGDFSEGIARLRDGMSGNTADHVPFIQQSHEFNMKFAGINARKYYSDPEKLIYGAFKTTRDMRFEVPDYCWDSYNIEAEALGSELITFDDLTPAIDNITPLIRTEADLAKLKPPVPGRSGRMGFAYDVASLYADLTGDPPCLICCAPFTLTTQIMTFEDVVLGMKDDPALIHKVMRFVVEEVLAPYINEFAKRYPNMTADCGDAVASLPFISMDMSEEFVVPQIERLRALTGGRAYVSNWWGDSYTNNVERFWRNKHRVCPDFIKVQDPDLFIVGAQKAKDWAVAEDKPIIFGLSNNLLQDGPVQDIQRRTHEYLEIAEPGGKSCLYFCNFGALAPVEHVKAAVKAVQMYRRGDRPWAGQHISGTEAARQTDARAARPAAPAKPQNINLSAVEEETLDDIFDSVVDGIDAHTPTMVQGALDAGIHHNIVLDSALIAAMDEVGAMFSDGTIFVPEMLLSARAMKAGLNILRPILARSKVEPKGLIMLATVQGDVHDIGKNLVGMMLEGAGFKVVDIGVNISPQQAIEKANQLKPDIIGLSALLTTTMPQMGKIIDAFLARGDTCPIIVGGAPVNRIFAAAIGADGYGADAPGAVKLAHDLMAERKVPRVAV